MNRLPNKWSMLNLRDIVDKARRITYGIVQAGPHIEGGIPYIRVSDMVKRRLTVEGMLRTSESIAQQYRRSAVRENDIVFALRGNPGLVVVVPPELDGANLTQGTARIAPAADIDNNFLLWALRSNFVQSDILKRLKGSTFKEITLEELGKIPIPVPPLAEQRKIAAILGTWDAAIATVEQLIAALQVRKQGLMQRLLTGAVRFPEFADSEWEEVRVIDVASNAPYSFTGGPFGSNLKASEYTESGVRIIQLQNIGDGEFLNDYQIFTSGQKADELHSCNIYPGDIILSKMGDPVARATIVPDVAPRFLMASDGIRLAVDRDRHAPLFILEQINSPEFRQAAFSQSIGSTRRRINLSDLRLLPLMVPSLPEQQRIAQIFANCNTMLDLLRREIAALNQQKQALMQQLLTGQVRVNVADEPILTS